MKKQYLECGKIVSTHGVRGGIVVESYCDSPSVLASFQYVFLKKNDEYLQKKIVSSFQKKGNVVLILEGLETLEDVINLRGSILYVQRDQIPLKEGAMLQEDMIGLPVIDLNTHQNYGTLLRIDPSPAQDLLVILREQGECYLPNIPVFVAKISDDGIFVTPPAGLF